MALIVFASPDAALTAAVGESLTKAGYAVRLEQSSTAALEALKRFCPSLVLVDSRMDGAVDLCIKIRETAPVPLVVILPPSSAHPQVDGPAWLEMGADYLLPMPLSRRELLARVHAIFRRRKFPRRPELST